MDRQAIIDDILRTALGSNDNAAARAPQPGQTPGPQIVVHARTVIVVEGPVILCDGSLRAADALPGRGRGLFGQALRSAAENRRRLERLGPPRFQP